jgi:gliding motility-associated peptidyl-prolyl isomerase
MRYFTLFLLLSLIISCRENTKPANQINQQQLQEPLIRINKRLMQKESSEINAYILRKKLQMKQSGTGLRYQILNQGSGDFVKSGMLVTVNYSVALLDGTPCYSSDSSGPRTFRVDQDQIESGLHEGIKLMKKGEKAKFILPSHLAFGLVGDDNKIPGRATVVYEIELTDITE